MALEEAKDDLLRRAAELGAHTSRSHHVSSDDALTLLRAYFRHVAPEDLIGRDPVDVYGPAMTHRHLAEERPQGRAVVHAFTPAQDEYGWDPGHSVVQIVTDDMPFLVDSVTMEIARHELGIYLVVHPQMRIYRDVTGRMIDIGAGSGEVTGQVLAESWMHIEIDRQSDQGVLKRLEGDLLRILGDVRYADEDSGKMRALAMETANEQAHEPPPIESTDIADTVELMGWLADGHFTFLGTREYRLDDGPALVPVPGTGLGILRSDKAGSDSFAALPPELRAKAKEKRPLVLTKANTRSTVHRDAYLDYIGVKLFDPDGEVVGERRFLGLYTHVASTESISRIPVLRRKLEAVLTETGIAADSYDGQDLIEILETFPRAELFQITVDELLPIALGVLRLRDRKQVRLFLRKDEFGRYMSCLVYMPRERYNTEVRKRVTDILLRTLGGTSFDFSVTLGESPLARLHVTVRSERGAALSDAGGDDLEQRIAAAVRSWEDELTAAISELCGEEEAPELTRRYAASFPEAYKADFPARTAVADLRRLEDLRASQEDVGLNLYKPYDAEGHERRLKIYKCGDPISLSGVLPRLQHMGVEVVDQRPYEIPPMGWVYDFGLRYQPAEEIPEDEVKEKFQDALAALWRGRVESDGFNALVLAAGLDWRQVEILRAYAKYLRQAGTTLSQRYIEQVLLSNVRLARLLISLFEARLDPRHQEAADDLCDALREEITAALDAVASLDEDRILRAFLEMIDATLRTNAYMDARPYLSLKVDPEAISVLPRPRPKYEIFVYSPRVEGVHLRFGKVARGGLRWSDRMEDFRTEILGLVKAQMVKNTVIVPTGSKGGFVVKQPPADGGTGGGTLGEGGGKSKEAVLEEGIACYKQFISGLLDITDNLDHNTVVPPDRVVRHDGDDTYLVVAADKGTATFSDIANEVAKEYNFWLGDAFASGGSVGYDHKAMGITARGAWESVKYHFRTKGIDAEADDITAVGIGDMSGDVFGNGMLLSQHLKLVAAFDHRHIFVDPSPDPMKSWEERYRLFELPRSSWADFDAGVISAGGGVWPRSAKSIPISPQMRSALGIPSEHTALPPYELIKAILRAPVQLLWNGGIGTYVKGATETHADVGDKANDQVRIDAPELRCEVVGEGGNLGLTQLARIEFARAGGMINTDFIDNSAGVDTSDHEVNIKILLDRIVRDGELTEKQRNQIFLDMTDEVAELVLRDNHAQNQVLDGARAQATSMLHVHARYLRRLEADGQLDRALEFLPSDKQLAERRQAGSGLTAPEFAVLLSYTKISAEHELLASDLHDDPYLSSWLVKYFPSMLRTRFADYMDQHPLRQEIIVNRVTNDLINNSGTTFLFRSAEDTGASITDITRAYLVTRDVFDMPSLWRAVESVDNKVSTDTQLAMLFEGRKLTERGSRWLLLHRRSPLDLTSTVSFFTEGMNGIMPHLSKMLVGADLAAYEERRDSFIARGVPADLAERVATMVPAFSIFDLVDISSAAGRPVQEVAEVYFDLADRLQLSRLRERIIALPRDNRWNTMARAALRDDLYSAHAALTRDVLVASEGSPEERTAAWAAANAAAVSRARQTLSEVWESDNFDLATLSVALRAIRALVTSSQLA